MLLIKISEYALLMFILVKALVQGSSFDGILFVILWCGLIVLARKERLVLIDNSVFAFLGRNITELFVLHIVLYYVLVQNQGVIRSGWKTMILLFTLSVIFAPILKACISKPFGKLNKKLLNMTSMS